MNTVNPKVGKIYISFEFAVRRQEKVANLPMSRSENRHKKALSISDRHCCL